MALTLIAGASANGTGTAVSVTHSFTILTNDVIIAHVWCDEITNTTTDNNGATPYTDAWQDRPGTASATQSIWSRVAGASEPVATAFTIGTSATWGIEVMQFRGVDTADIWDIAPAAGQEGSGQDEAPTTPAMTTANNGSQGIVVIGVDSGSATIGTYSNSYTDEQEPGTGAISSSMVTRNFATSGVQPAVTTVYTGTTGKKWGAIQVSLNEAAAGASTGQLISSLHRNQLKHMLNR